jgi:tetratricopeptide (TPR) repeat protein/capsular polysaccharide biosynthesis protein
MHFFLISDSPSMAATSKLRLHELHYNLGHVLHQQGDLLGAAQNYRESLALIPNYATAHLNLAVVLDEQGQLEGAIAHYSQAIALQPNSVKAHNNLGCALAKQGHLDAAIQSYQQAIALQPTWATLYINLGQVLFQRSPLEAVEAYRQAISLSCPQGVALQPNLVAAHHNLGKALQFLGQHTAAIEAFQTVLTLQPNHPQAQADCGFSKMAQGQIKQALSYLRAAIAPQSHLIAAYCQWVEQMPPIDELSKARIACGRLLKKLQQQTEGPELYEQLAQTYLHLGNVLASYGGDDQYRQAELYYQRSLQLQPRNFDLYLNLADCLVQQKRLNAAILVYHSAMAVNSEFLPYAELGQVLEQQQNLSGAIAYYRQAFQSGRTHLQGSTREKPAFSVKASSEPKIDAIQGFYYSTQDWFTASGLSAEHYCPLSSSALSPAPLGQQPVASPSSPSCSGLNCSSCLQNIITEFEPVHLGEGIHAFPKQDELNIPALPLFTATIPNGKAWAVPQQNNWMVCNALAVMTPENQLLADVSRDYPGQLPGCKSHEPTHHRIFSQPEIPPLEKIAGSVAVLSGLSGHNYFHWMVDVLPRLELLRRSMSDRLKVNGLESNASKADWSEIDWFWINGNQHQFQQDTLEALGIPAEKVLSSDRHPHIQASKLVVPSFPSHLGWAEPWAIDFLRQTFLPLAIPSSQLPERIYICRANAHHRRVLNEDQVIEQLRPFGFVAITLESMPFIEQVALFANAKVVFAPHGGGLTNTVFCRPGTVVVEYVAPQYIRHYYWVVSHLLRLEHYFVRCEELNCFSIRQLMYPSPLTEDMWIQPDVLAKILHRIGLTMV